MAIITERRPRDVVSSYLIAVCIRHHRWPSSRIRCLLFFAVFAMHLASSTYRVSHYESPDHIALRGSYAQALFSCGQRAQRQRRRQLASDFRSRSICLRRLSHERLTNMTWSRADFSENPLSSRGWIGTRSMHVDCGRVEEVLGMGMWPARGGAKTDAMRNTIRGLISIAARYNGPLHHAN